MDTAPDTPTPARNARLITPWLALLLLTVLALALRFWRIAGQSLWLDEAASRAFSLLPPGELLRRNADPGNPPLYYLMLAAWRAGFGDSEAALRGLSAVLGALTVPVLYALGRELFGRRVALLAAGLLALSPIHLYYSQEARQYVPVLWLGALAAWLFTRALRANRWGDWLGSASLMAVACYVHYSALLIPAFAAAYLLLACRRRADDPSAGVVGTRALAAGAVLLLLALPGIWLYLAPTFLAADGYQYWQGYLTPAGLAKMLNKLFGRPVAAESPRIVKAGVGLLLGVVTAYPLYLGARAARQEAPGALRPILFALAYLLVPLLCYGAFARLRPAWQDRYLFVALPGYLLLVAWALLELRGGRRLVLAGSLALLYAGGMASSLAGWQKDDWRGVARAVEQATAVAGETQGEVLITRPYLQLPFDYYYRGKLPRTGLPDWRRPLGDEDAAAVTAFCQRHAGHSSVFVVEGMSGSGDPGALVAERLLAQHGEGWMRHFTGVRVFAFGRAGPALGGEPLTLERLHGRRPERP